jgi:hypothetical protein
LAVDDSALLGGAEVGGGIACDAAPGGAGTCAACCPSLLGVAPPVGVAFIEAQPETDRTARNPAITDRRIDAPLLSRYDPTPLAGNTAVSARRIVSRNSGQMVE